MVLENSLLKIVIILIQIITLCLTFGLFNIYRKSFKKIKIGYTVGLLIFALLLIVKTVAELIIMTSIVLFGNPINPMEYHELFGAIIELIAISVLYKVTKDY